MMKNYRIVIGSPVAYKELTAEIVINGKYVALIQKEEGDDKMIIELYEKPADTKIYFDDLIAALQEAKEELLK
ncbi:hypothetical protein GFS24_06870 [Chitinophaga sp. SYP-B3965]|uniref:hypothetical protein n=1 Tax=Chitinophaga sp. SYP-B3965 TaxID=2663120 RepID=UPI001299B70C|nr:hypothetical protein [Chitinophaga sp. SYP-B3965]MRG44829.1 hypothetical protein [Chitinophaga sp. SYP-B3965]